MRYMYIINGVIMNKKLFLLLAVMAFMCQSSIVGMDNQQPQKTNENKQIETTKTTLPFGFSPMQIIKQCYRKICLERGEVPVAALGYLVYDYFVKNPTIITRTTQDVMYNSFLFENEVIKRSKSRSPLLKYLAGGVLGLKIAYELLGADQITEINERTKVIDQTTQETNDNVKNVQVIINLMDQELKKHGLSLAEILKNQGLHTELLSSLEKQQKLDAETLKTLTVDISGIGKEQKEQTSKLVLFFETLQKIEKDMATKNQVVAIVEEQQKTKQEQTSGFKGLETLIMQGFDNSATKKDINEIKGGLEDIQKTQLEHSASFLQQEKAKECLLTTMYVMQNFLANKEQRKAIQKSVEKNEGRKNLLEEK